MRDPNILSQLLVFLLAPVVVVPIFRWMRSSQILGYLAAGVLTGPS
jgi:Kef-type K+ transport system membrane component KefB